ncbi:MAG: hypothetical protein RSD12_09670 [Akkermansia sp.]
MERPNRLGLAQGEHDRPNGVGSRKENHMKKKRTYLWAYLDGVRLVEVIKAALDNNMMVGELKAKLVAENPGHEVTFKTIEK